MFVGKGKEIWAFDMGKGTVPPNAMICSPSLDYPDDGEEDALVEPTVKKAQQHRVDQPVS